MPIDQVIRREPAIEVNVSQQSSGSQAVEGAIDSGAVDRRIAISNLFDQCISRQMIAACRDDTGQQRDSWLGDALAGGTKQLGRFVRERRHSAAFTGHKFSVHPCGAGGLLVDDVRAVPTSVVAASATLRMKRRSQHEEPRRWVEVTGVASGKSGVVRGEDLCPIRCREWQSRRCRSAEIAWCELLAVFSHRSIVTLSCQSRQTSRSPGPDRRRAHRADVRPGQG